MLFDKLIWSFKALLLIYIKIYKHFFSRHPKKNIIDLIWNFNVIMHAVEKKLAKAACVMLLIEG